MELSGAGTLSSRIRVTAAGRTQPSKLRTVSQQNSGTEHWGGYEV